MRINLKQSGGEMNLGLAVAHNFLMINPFKMYIFFIYHCKEIQHIMKGMEVKASEVTMVLSSLNPYI